MFSMTFLFSLMLVGSPANWEGVTRSVEEATELNETCLECHRELDKSDAIELPDGAMIDVFVDALRLEASVHGGALACIDCHKGYVDDEHAGIEAETLTDLARVRSESCRACHGELESAHEAGEGGPDCTDCHRAHSDTLTVQGLARFSRRCGDCHEDELVACEAGGHAGGVSVEDRNPDLPDCVTCHPPHRSVPDRIAEARVAATARCIECHSNPELAHKYDLPVNAVRSYRDDFHGETYAHLRGASTGNDEVGIMICADCHDSHGVAGISYEELAAVCSQCHEDTDRSFVSAWMGHEPIRLGHNGSLVWLIRTAYQILIPLILAGLILNIALQVQYRWRKRAKMRREGGAAFGHAGDAGGVQDELPEAERLPKTMVRFGWAPRLEHFFAASLFVFLVVSGLPQSYPESWLCGWIIELGGGIATVRFLHRVAGVAFAVLAVAHLARALVIAMRERRLPALVPTRKDFRDTLVNLRHYLGRSERPRFGRFDYRQKFEYWGLFLGGTLMVATGFVLIFPEAASRVLPGFVLAAARVAHGLEATLAVLVVVVWHFYEVFLRADIFPMDTSIFSGRIATERLRKEHPIEFERWVREEHPAEFERWFESRNGESATSSPEDDESSHAGVTAPGSALTRL